MGYLPLALSKAFTAALVLIFAFPPQLAAQTIHIASPQELQSELLKANRMRKLQRQTLRQFLSSKDVERGVRAAHIDPVQVTNGVALLSDAELARLAARADSAERDFAAGAMSKEAWLIVGIAVAVVIIIVVAKT